MLSVALFTNAYHPMRNGVVVSVSTLAGLLTEMGHRVTIFTACHPDQREREEHVCRFPSITLPMRTRYPLAIPVATDAACRLFDEERFDLIHSHHPVLLGEVALQFKRRHRLPFVFTYHTLLEEYTHYFPLPRAWARGGAIRLSREYSNQADHIITPAEHVAARLRGYRVTKPITVIPTGIDIDFFDQAPPGDVRTQFAIPAGVPLLVCVGRIAREKNLSRVLTAFGRVLRDEPDAFLLLVGGGPLEPALRGEIRHRGLESRVRLTGLVARDTVAQAMREADLFVFASHTETQGLVLGEAMACHTPVVAVASDAAREMVVHGEEGLLVPDADKPFAEAILTLLRDPALRERMGARARLHAEALSARRCTARVVDAYRQVIAEYAESATPTHP